MNPPRHPLAAMALPLRVLEPVLVVVTIALWLPALAVLATVAAVFATGCEVSEAASHPCIVAGHDIGDVLGTGLLMVFFAGPTLPFAIGGVIVCVLLRRRRKAGSPKSIS